MIPLGKVGSSLTVFMNKRTPLDVVLFCCIVVLISSKGEKMKEKKKFGYLVHYEEEKKFEVFLKLLKLAGQNFFLARADSDSRIVVGMFTEDQRAEIEAIDGVMKVEKSQTIV